MTSKILYALLGCAVTVLVFLSLGTIIGNSGIVQLLNLSTAIAAPTPVAVVDSSPTILQSIQPLGQLVTIGAEFAKADIRVSVTQGTLNACGLSANHVAVGSIEAGVDLTEVEAEDITYDSSTGILTIRLPAPELTSCRINFIRQYERSTTVCGVDWDEIRIIANVAAIEDFRTDAIENGLLVRAKHEASIALETFVRALTGNAVQIVFEEVANPTYPVSCQGQAPQGWTYDTESNNWTKS